MTRDRDLDLERLLDQWFAVGADRAPEAAVERGIELAWASPQAAPLPVGLRVRDVRAWLRSPAVRVVVVASLGLLALAAIVAIAGSRPSVVTFTSERYGYTVDVPADWTVEPAAFDWRVTQPWDVAPSADAIHHGDRRFTAVALPISVYREPRRWAEVFVPERPELSEPRKDPRCLDPRGLDVPLPIASYRGWEPATIGGLGAVIRVACGYVDAVITTGRYAYVLSMFTGRQPYADIAAFDAVVRTIRFTPPAPTPVPATPSPTAVPTPEPATESFTSPLYGYTIRHPASWVIEPAVEAWAGTGRVDGPRTADEFRVPRGLSIVAAELPASASLEGWITGHVPLPSAHTAVSPGQAMCRFGGTMMRISGAGWREGRIGGRPAWIRAECGTVDGVVAVGDRVYVVRLDTGRRPDGDVAAFQVMVGNRLDFAADAPIRPLEPDDEATFVSSRFGYQVRAPWRWSFEPARRSAEDLRPPRQELQADPTRDRFVDRVHVIVVASAPVPTGTTARDWVDAHAPRRQVMVGEAVSCRTPTGAVMGIPAESWRPTRVAGLDAVERDSCYVIDVVVVVGGRAYVISASSSAPVQTPAGSRASLDALLGSIAFTPETARDD